MRGQTRYYAGRTYEQDFYINCQGDCTITSNGHDLKQAKPFTVLACPPDFAFGTQLWIEGVGIATCHDRGGAIKGHRLDLWAGIGEEGLDNLMTGFGGGLREIIQL